jgi:ADP-ribosylglycohydrolase
MVSVMVYLGFGSIAGDVIGSLRERENEKQPNIVLLPPGSRMTDDSIMTIASMLALIENPLNPNYTEAYRKLFRLYPEAGFGKMFRNWGNSDSDDIINSFGNGSGMRVGPIGLVFKTMDQTLEQAKISASITHSHPEGIKGAQAVAGCVYLARRNYSKRVIKLWIEDTIGYDLNFTIEKLRPIYERNVTCQGSIPQAIVAFLESSDFESAIRLAISLGGDSDTIAAMAGAIAEPFYGIPEFLFNSIMNVIEQDKFLIDIVREFNSYYNR